MKKIFLFFIFLILPIFILAAEKVEINTASLEELDQITGIGPVMAQKIIDARPFFSVDDLLRVKGIGEKTLQKIKDQRLAYVGNPNGQIPITNQTPNPNNENVIKKTLPEMPKVYSNGIIFSEILPSPEGADEEGEWIEIQNTNNFEVDLSGWKIEDIEGTQATYVFGRNLPAGRQAKIPAGGYLVFKRPETKITLNNSADGLNLFWPDGKIIDSVDYQSAPKNQSYNRSGNLWVWSLNLTPGAKNIISQPKNTGNNALPKSKNSDNNNVEAGLAGLSQTAATNPWFLFFTALIITIISAVAVLFIKFRFYKNLKI